MLHAFRLSKQPLQMALALTSVSVSTVLTAHQVYHNGLQEWSTMLGGSVPTHKASAPTCSTPKPK